MNRTTLDDIRFKSDYFGSTIGRYYRLIYCIDLYLEMLSELNKERSLLMEDNIN